MGFCVPGTRTVHTQSVRVRKYCTRVLCVWANRTPLFGRLDLRNPNSLDLADTIAPFSQYLKMA